MNNKKYQCIYIITDVETTGLDYINDVVFDIAFLITDGEKVIDSYNSLIKVDEYLISKAIENIGHIVNIDKDAISASRDPKIVFEECLHFLKKHIQEAKTYKLVAHSVNIDYTMTIRSMSKICSIISEEYKNMFKDNKIDTLALSKQIFPSLKRHSLSYIVETLKIDEKGLLQKRDKEKHSALLDCEILFLLLKHIFHNMPFINI